MLNEFIVNLEVPDNLELTLKIGKSKKQKFSFSYLFYKNSLVRKIDSSLLPESYNDGDTIAVTLKGTDIVDNNTNEIIYNVGNQIFDNNILVELVKKDDIVEIMFDDLVLDTKEVNYFGFLYTVKYKYNCARRTNYKGFIIGLNKISIVRYVNTHQHTEYSRLDGMTKLKDIAKKTEWASAITDHGNMTGVLKFDSLMRGEHKKPIIGCEGYIEEIDDNLFQDIYPEEITDEYIKSHYKREHIILLAKNNIGYKNLVKLISLSHNHFYNKNHIVYSELKDLSEGIIATSACLGSTFGRTILEDEKNIRNAFFDELGIHNFNLEYRVEDDFDIIAEDDLKLKANEKELLTKIYNYTSDYITKADIEELIKNDAKFIKTNEEIQKYGHRARLYVQKMIELFGREDFYIEIQRHKFYSESYVEQILLDFAKEFNLKIVTGIDNHYLNKEDAPIHEMWLCESTKKNLDDPTRMKFPGEGYWFMTSNEVLDLFSDLPEAMDNSLEIADKCNVDLSPKGYELPKYPLPEGYGDTKEEQIRYFKEQVIAGYKRRFLGTELYTDKRYLDRIKFEMKTILNMGFESYFLIVQDYISWAKDKNVAENIEKYFPKAHYDWDKIPDAIKNKTDEIYVGPGRGSAAGSLVAYCLGITNINPIDYDLLFERKLKMRS